jgi:5-(carboxyamino)imidazole ribonucleotide synthase
MQLKTLGILGSGQLGRMLAMAAATRGIKAHIFAPDAAGSPAAEIAHSFTQAGYYDETALAAFASQIDAVTSEFENVPASSMRFLASHVPASPGHTALHIAQNRLREKHLASSVGIATPKFWAITSADELAAALSELDTRAILKTTEQGYDGKGQMQISARTDAHEAWQALNTHEAILESFVDFQFEISVLVWRDRDGQMGCFPVAQNQHKSGILHQTIAPAPDVDASLARQAEQAACAIAEAVDLFGVMAMEAFVSRSGEIIFNEIAPRPHNSFHWTIEGCITSQFTQAVRIALQQGAGDCSATGIYKMENLLGEDMARLDEISRHPSSALHLYGKAEARDGRKMGHVTTRLSGLGQKP